MTATDDSPLTLDGLADSIDFDRFGFDADADRTARALSEPLLVFPQYGDAPARDDGDGDGGRGGNDDHDDDQDGDGGPICTGLYTVVSANNDRTYTVDAPRGDSDAHPTCSCPDFEHRGLDGTDGGCKHIRRVRILQTENVLPRRGEGGGLWEDKLREVLANLSDEAADVEQRRENVEKWARVVGRLRDRLQEHVEESYGGP